MYLPDNVILFKKKVEKEMKSGFISLSILYTIYKSDEPIYGYKIIQNIENISRGYLKIQQGSVYSILHYFQDKGFITSTIVESKNGAPRKNYTITDQGKIALREGLKIWKGLEVSINLLLADFEVE